MYGLVESKTERKGLIKEFLENVQKLKNEKKAFEEKMKNMKHKNEGDIEKSRKRFENDMAVEDFQILLQEIIKTDVKILLIV